MSLPLTDERAQAILFAARERRASRADPARGLFRTHRIFDGTALPVATIDGARFPDTDRAVTFRTAIQITGASPVGLIFELGSSTQGLSCGLDGTVLAVECGDTGDVSREIELSHDFGAGNLPVGRILEIVVSVRPDGAAVLWVDGSVVDSGTAPAGFLNNDWSDGADGSFMSDPAGTFFALTNAPGATGAPTDFIAIEPLSAYTKQLPQQFATAPGV